MYGTTELESDSGLENKFSVFEYIHNGEEFRYTQEVIDISSIVGDGAGHGSGDVCIMRDYVRYLNGDNSSISITSIEDSINGHLCVYAAEKSRKNSCIIKI